MERRFYHILQFEFTKEQEQFRSVLTEFAETELLPNYARWDRQATLPRSLWKKLAELGVNGLRIPEKYGGSEADCITTGIAAFELAKGDFNLTYSVMLNALISEIISGHASEYLKNKWLPLIASGEKVVGIALTEPGAGTDAAGIKTTAIRKKDGFVINGEKSGISVATVGDAFIVFAKTAPEKASGGISAFLIPAELSGVEVRGYEDMGNRPISRGSLFFNDVEVPEENLIGQENKGFVQVMNGFDLSRILIGLQCLGAATQSLDETIEYVKLRQSFGKPLAKYQGVAFPIVEHVTKLEMVQWLAYRGLWLRDQGLKHTKEAAAVKWLGPKYSREAIHDCLLLNGHYAYTKEMAHEQRLRDVIGLEIGDGTAQVNQMIIATELFGKAYRPR
ncbi:MAG: acyl-CoA dehydrogenase family protein [Tuberibacillus sp.]